MTMTTSTITTTTTMATTTMATTTMATGIAGASAPPEDPLGATSLASLEFLYFKAVSFYRRRNYEKCSELCNAMLEAGHANNVQMFASSPADEDDRQQLQRPISLHSSSSNNNNNNNNNMTSNIGSNLQRAAAQRHGRRQYNNNNTIGSSGGGGAGSGGGAAGSGGGTGGASGAGHGNKVVMPTWMMEGVWLLKMRALTQRIYVDDLETNDDDNIENEEVEFERIATAARPGTSIKTAFVPRPSTASARASTSRTVRAATGRGKSTEGSNLTAGLSARPTSGMARPGTALSRPGSALGTRPASRCGTASRVRTTSAAAYSVGDSTAALYQASRYNPTIYADRPVLVKALFQFVFYHESDVQKAYSLCEAVMEVQKKQLHRLAQPPVDWWWLQQLGRCLLALRYPRKAEAYLQQSLAAFPHPDTYLLLSRLLQRLEQPERALQLINTAVDRHPFDVTFRTEQGRIFDLMSKPDDAMQIYRLIAKLNPINIEALACIAVNYFYDNNPEMALMYYRRILSLGVHTPELYCNIALCCLYGGQIDLVLPCFRRALRTANTADQKADIWYNLSFVAINTGDFNLARRCLQLCLTSDACNGAALNNMAVLSAHNGDVMKAKSYLSAAKEVLEDSVEIENNLNYMEAHYKL